MEKFDEKQRKKQIRQNRILVFLGLSFIFILLFPVRKFEVYTVPESQGGAASLLRHNDLSEGEKLRNALDILLKDDLRLEENNYPATMTFRWTGGPLNVSPGKKADHIAWTIHQYTDRSVSITLQVGEQKYYGYYSKE